MIPGLRRALNEIDVKHQGEPDFDARNWLYEGEDEIELVGDDFARMELDDEL